MQSIGLFPVFAAIAVVSCGVALDALGSRLFPADPRGLALRLAAHGALLGALFLITLFKPISSMILYLGAICVLALASASKFALLRERLVFADLLLVKQVVLYPQMYYTSARDWRVWAIGAGALAVVAAVASEPSAASCRGAGALALVGCVALFFALARGGARPAADGAVREAPQEADRLIGEAGLLGALVLAAARGALGRPSAGGVPGRRRAVAPPEDALIVAVQCESFLAGERFAGGPALPCFEALRERSDYAGRVEVPAYGANTMRTEFSFVAGLGNAELGAARFNPYLNSGRYADASLTGALRAGGWRTVFVHPNHPRFFDRLRAIPDLGFERFVDESAFVGAARKGPYVSDEAVAAEILRLSRETPSPAFIFAATMENHGPWKPGRLGGAGGFDCFREHLVNADRMIGMLAEALGRRAGPTVLCVFGDHLPVMDLPGVDDIYATDYAIARLDRAGEEPAVRRMRVEDLLAAAVELARAPR